MFRRRWFSSPKIERRYFFSTNQGSCDIYADGVYVGRYLGTGITEFTYSTSRNYINISLVGISLPDQVYNYTNGTINDDRYSHELQAWGFCVHVKEGVNQ